MQVLMISYPFPPWGGNTKRAVHQANHLADQGHEVHVLAVNPSRYHPLYDPALISMICPKVCVHRSYAGSLHHLRYRYPRLFTAGNSEWPDPLVSKIRSLYASLLKHVVFPLTMLEWLLWGLAYAYGLCRRHKFDLVYSHGDPYVSNFVGLFVKKCFGLPWVMYIGDPRYFSSFSVNKSLLRMAEVKCLKAADRIIVNCEETRQGYFNHFPFLEANRFAIITDGFDDDIYRQVEPEISVKFRIVFTGTFYDHAREPYEFVRALETFRPPELEVVFAGNIGSEYTEFVKAKDLAEAVKFLGHQSYERVVSLQKGASLLLTFGRAGGYQVPGKLFEYFGAKRPILVVRSDPRDVASKYVLRHNRGLVVDSDATEISQRLRDLYTLWRAGRLEASFDLRELEEFSMKRLSERTEQELLHVVQTL